MILYPVMIFNTYVFFAKQKTLSPANLFAGNISNLSIVQINNNNLFTKNYDSLSETVKKVLG